MSTPLRAQYLRLKQPFPDALLLFRLGDFYEVYGRDATIAARELGLTLTAREFAGGERVQMCPFPYHAAEGRLKHLVARGYKVAIAEQIDDPCITKGLVEREVVRVVTPALAVDTCRCLPSALVVGQSADVPHGSGVPLLNRERDTSIMITGTNAEHTPPIYAAGPCDTGRVKTPAVQLALFNLPAGGDDRGR